jgi:hypothetical protein
MTARPATVPDRDAGAASFSFLDACRRTLRPLSPFEYATPRADQQPRVDVPSRRGRRTVRKLHPLSEKSNVYGKRPEHRDLATELALGGGHMSLLTKQDGSAFDSNGRSEWFAAPSIRPCFPMNASCTACVMHGLRQAAARALAEVGCTQTRSPLSPAIGRSPRSSDIQGGVGPETYGHGRDPPA